MNPHIQAVLAQARHGALDPSSPSDERLRLQRLAAEFESTLMLQVLKEMRRAGKWDEEAGDDGFALGSVDVIFEMLDAELASQMARQQGVGLAPRLLAAYDRMSSLSPDAAAPAGNLETGVPVVSSVLDRARITSGYGWRQDPFTGEARFHRGVDIRAAYGEDVPAAAGGRVLFSGVQGGYGTTVVVEHGDGTRTRYAHLSVALVRKGDAVAPGQIVGQAGSSGRATGPHVHFEVLDRNGRPVDPTAR